MGFRDLFRPKWQSSKPRVREKAVAALQDISIVEQMAQSDPSADVRLAAIKRLENPSVLAAAVKNDSDSRVRREAARKITDQSLLSQVATADRAQDVRMTAVKKLTDEDTLQSIARNQKEESAVRIAAAAASGDEKLAKHLKEKEEIIQEVKRLARALGDANNIARYTAADAIAKIAEAFPEEAAAGIPALEEALTDKHNQMARAEAAYALGKIGKYAVSAVPKLQRALANETQPMPKNAMRKAIEQIVGG